MTGHRRHLMPRFTPGAVLLACVLLAGFCAQAARGQCEVQKLTVPDGYMGRVSVCGDVAVHGNVNGNNGIGAAFVYRRDGMSWVFEAELTPPNPDPEDEFGGKVAISGDVVVVGAEGTSAPEYKTGAAHVYRHDPGSGEWNHEAMLLGSEGDYGDYFGRSVAVDGDLILIGAPGDEVNGETLAGSAYIFRHNGTEWVEEIRLVAPEPEYYGLFGYSVSIDGDLAMIGSYGDGWFVGAAYVYRYEGAQWVLEERLIAPDPGVQDRFGWAVSLRAGVAVSGAIQADGQNGAAYVFRRTREDWEFEAKLSASDPVGPGPAMGYSVSVSSDGGAVLAGAPFDRALGFDGGAAHVFRKVSGCWEEAAKLTNSDGGALDLFGGSVAFDSDAALIAASGASPPAAYAFAGLSGGDCNDNGNADTCDIFEGTSEDLNENGIPDECEAIGDLDGNGFVNVRDLLTLLGAWGACDEPCPPACIGDTNFDCTVNWIDLLNLLSNWGAH